ncbi:unnamed protein product [Coffea canephora]|uniref:Large ribosomal subunit protein uL23 N-terminal domain-containing protein n=1 Tax=Coffea canephora TaxID=49390 RepID=A0A068UBT8_COFCA|nr:unnamed protein product [Coffea canephora]
MAPKADTTKKLETKAQAAKVAKFVKSGTTFKKKAKKIRTKVTFHRPNTFKIKIKISPKENQNQPQTNAPN